jgi:hypothetical protein
MSGMRGDSIDRHAAVAADEVMNGPMRADQHMVMTPHRSPAPGDSARAAALLAEMRRGLVRYKSADTAIANGYRPLFPGVPQPVYHFTNLFKTPWASGCASIRRGPRRCCIAASRPGRTSSSARCTTTRPTRRSTSSTPESRSASPTGTAT